MKAYRYLCRVKGIVAISCALLLLLVSASDIIIYGYFKAEQEQILEKYCVNVDRPAVMCKAQCYFSSLIEQSHSTKAAMNLDQDLSKNLVVFCQVIDSEVSKSRFLTDLDRIYFKPNHYRSQESFSIFHPPKYSC